MNGPQPALSDLQIAAHARKAGFVGEGLATIIAVVLAESGGDPDNVGDESLTTSIWGPSIGLGQVRCLWAERGTGRSRDCNRLPDPAFNMKSAYAISSGGTSFKPWTQFVNGEYRSFLARARAAIAGTPLSAGAGGGGGGGVQLLGGGIPGGGLVESVTEPLRKGMARIVLVGILVAGGVVFVAAGAWKAVAPTRQRIQEATVERATTAAQFVPGPAGAAATAAKAT
ncbi:MAG TPA: hypothetical protein VJ931_19265, partial [Actinomycetota bacterium]|nr:hypothetical protein [Actinomycetota bacterium]